MEILHVTGQPFNDYSIEEYQFHTYQPYIPGKLGYNDEIRIPIQDLDALTVPANSYLYIEGQLLTHDNKVPTKLKFINNAIAYLFREIRFELNGVVIDSVRDVGLVSSIKSYLSLNENQSLQLQNAGWFPKRSRLETNKEVPTNNVLVDSHGNFNVCIPLRLLLGFCEDFTKVILNVKMELILIRSNDDIDAVVSEDESERPKIDITKLNWEVPHVTPSIREQLRLNKISHSNQELPIKFRSWQMIEYPALNNSTRHTWSVRTSTKIETPRHIIVAFQNNRKSKLTKDMSKFDHCTLKNIKVFLNSERYPYNDLQIDFKTNRFAKLYEMFANFQESYYHMTLNQPIFNPNDFQTIAPLVHIDCSRQKEVVQVGSVVLRIEFETDEPTTSDISAYCLILHEKEFTYNPLTKIVKQL
ncbi:uncharacterized protein LOC126891535 [Diabrotica virgifera virgifera]|uniref:Double jelly roll-like domain-containing protein n=2 Tax=Diabrotica virgifera virgifera TaxID=50390 RepID=A0ABM5L2J9_DIAVI|nr:uncharacterized protein LOC126891535 [Diabrotica virgifera virgifera]